MRRRATLAHAAAFALLALYEAANALLAPHRVASAADWDAAAAEVRAGFRDGDLITFAPYWADQIGRAHLGDLMPVEMIARSDDAHYARAWVVSIRGARSEAESGQLVSQTQHGRVRVALWDRGAAPKMAFDFRAHLADARVTQAGPDGGERPCYQDAGGFRCAGGRVERRTLEIDYRPRLGILVPVDPGLTTRLEFQNVPGRGVRGYTGIHDYYARKSADGKVDFQVFVDGRAVASATTGNASGWLPFRAAAGDGPTHTVRFEVSSHAPAWRSFGFHAEMEP
jgi:hypothetical protein